MKDTWVMVPNRFPEWFTKQAPYLVDKDEAPEGFVAVHKNEATTPNVCNSCDARRLCQRNEDEWCLKNRCIAVGVIASKNGKTYSRNDRQSVYFKKI